MDIRTSGRRPSEQEARNLEVVLDYYGKLFGGWVFDSARERLGDRFKQHNLTIGNVLPGLEAFVRIEPPPIANSMRHRIGRALVDRDFVMLHTSVTMLEHLIRSSSSFFGCSSTRLSSIGMWFRPCLRTRCTIIA